MANNNNNLIILCLIIGLLVILIFNKDKNEGFQNNSTNNINTRLNKIENEIAESIESNNSNVEKCKAKLILNPTTHSDLSQYVRKVSRTRKRMHCRKCN